MDGKEVEFGPFPPAHEAAERYARKAGIPYRPLKTYAKLDRERAKRIAEAYEQMGNDYSDAEALASYEAMARETIEQYKEVLATGLKIEYITGEDPYGNPRNAILDVHNNNHLWVFPSDTGFGTDTAFSTANHPLLRETEFEISGRKAKVNDLFRVVHDYFGHIKDGVGFRAEGEENAWRSHSAMYSPLARKAMTVETRGQNTWVNFGPHAEHNVKASGYETHYADQKIGLLPDWVVEDGSPDVLLSRDIEAAREHAKALSSPVGILEAYRKNLGARLYEALAAGATRVLAPIKLADNAPAGFKVQMRRMRAEVLKRADEASDVASRAAELTVEERNLLSDIIEDVAAPGVIPPAKLQQLAVVMRAALRQQREELIKLRMLGEDVRGRWGDRYLARYYAKHLMDIPLSKELRAMRKRIEGSHMKGRGQFEVVPAAEREDWEALGWEARYTNADGTHFVMWRDWSPEKRAEWGETRDAIYRFVRGYLESGKDIAMGRLFEQMAQSDYTSDVQMPGYVQVPETTIGPLTPGMKWQVKRNPEGQFVPRSAYKYGALAGKWVPEAVWDHLADVWEEKGELAQAYLKALSLWKEGKTAMNPVVHSNNIVSNVVMAYWAVGHPALNPLVYQDVLAEYINKGEYYREGREAGLFGTEYYASEIRDMIPTFPGTPSVDAATAGWVRKTWERVYSFGPKQYREAMGTAYQAEDQFFKLLIYRHARMDWGMSKDAAIDFAERYIFNYADVPKGIRFMSRSLWPFFKYTYKAIPAVFHTAIVYPERLAATWAALTAANAIGYMFSGVDGDESDEERKKREEYERRVMPDYMKGRSLLGTWKALRMPANDEGDMALFMDVSRRLPLGTMLDAVNQSGGVALIEPLMPSNPLFTMAVGALANKDMFTGDEIVPAYDQDYALDKYSKIGSYLLRQALPNTPLMPASYSFNKVMNGLVGSLETELGPYSGRDYRGTQQNITRALGDTVLGIKLRAFNAKDAETSRIKEQTYLRGELLRDFRSEMKGNPSEWQKAKLKEERAEKMQRIMQNIERIRTGEEPEEE